MSIKKHKDYAYEIKRLKATKEHLENTIGTVVNQRIKYKENIKEAFLNLDYLDSSLSYSSIMMNSTLLDHLEKNFELLLHARKKPYFARMDVKLKDKAHEDQLYIGKISLDSEDIENPLVIDWRAPIASVYYDGRLGEANYLVEGVEHTIDLLNKRQYTIEEGALLDFMDVDISTTDTFLQASLENHAGEKLKDIVSTIQGEQNQIIRADIDKPLIVQGVAGSGKTTIALHRIAYLMYTYAEQFHPEEFMIIAPNTLFLDYISTVLPELGADKTRQTTYIDLMFEMIEKRLKLTDSNQKLNELIRTDQAAMSHEDKNILKSASRLKNSMAMKTMLDRYIADIEGKILPKEDLYLEDIMLLDQESISQLYYDSYSYLPFYKRVDSIKKYITAFTRNQTKTILEEIEADFNHRMDFIRDQNEPSEKRRQMLVALMSERDCRLDIIKKSSKTVVKKYMNQFFTDDLFGFYREFLTRLKSLSDETDDTTVLDYIKRENQESKKKSYELEDLAPLVYMKKRIFGFKESLDIKMVVIDEAQDFSDFQFYVLHEMINTDRYTILGDLSQGIHMYRAIEDWDYLRASIFEGETSYLTLEQSYRTTIEIMEEANFVLEQLSMEHIIKARPVVRHGKKPSYTEYTKESEIIDGIVLQVEQWQKDKLTTMAIITKTNQEAERVFKLLEKRRPDLNPALIDEKTEHFDHKILVIPAHLAKGLEFDAVIITTLHERFEIEPLDIKLLYVAMTRAMHRLALIVHENSMAYYLPELERESNDAFV